MLFGVLSLGRLWSIRKVRIRKVRIVDSELLGNSQGPGNSIPLKLKKLLESNPLKSRFLVRERTLPEGPGLRRLPWDCSDRGVVALLVHRQGLPLGSRGGLSDYPTRRRAF